MRLKPPPEVEEEPGQFWKLVRDTAPEFRKPTIEQLETFTGRWASWSTARTRSRDWRRPRPRLT